MNLRNVDIVFAAVVVTGLYWVFGAGLILLCYVEFASTLNSFWLDVFRPTYCISGMAIVVFLYGFKKNRGLFLESLAFFMALSMAMIYTLEMIIYVRARANELKVHRNCIELKVIIRLSI